MQRGQRWKHRYKVTAIDSFYIELSCSCLGVFDFLGRHFTTAQFVRGVTTPSVFRSHLRPFCGII